MTTFRVQNKYLENDRVANAIVSIHPTAGGAAIATGTTNRWGNVAIDTASLTNGTYVLRITAPHTSLTEVGPATASMVAPPSRIYRILDIIITMMRSNVTAANIRADQLRNGTVQLGSNPRITAKLQPVWMQSPNHRDRGSVTIDKVIIHHTGGNTTVSALNTFLSNGSTSPHYIIDKEGYIIKMVQETRVAYHAGRAKWRGSTTINDSSIGVEIVHRAGDYPEAQYTSVIALLGRIQAAHTTVVRRNIIGHSDVGVDATERLGRKATDPGLSFDWQRLETNNLGLGLGATPTAAGLYGNFFTIAADSSFRLNDNDATNIYGGVVRETVVGDPIQEIQNDLTTIGYSVGTPDGDYGQMTHWGIKMFQEHFHAGGRGPVPNGRLDNATAVMLKRVVAGL